MPRKKTLLALCLLLKIATATAQPKCKVDYYSTENGLSHKAITCMIQDKEGFMWFGSWDGINRFDGHSFSSYKSSPGDRSQLANDRVDKIVEDQSNHLWIIAYDLQVYRFDKSSREFWPLAPILQATGKKKVNFNKILHASNGWVWLQSINDGLYCVPQNDMQPGRFLKYNQHMPAAHRLPSDSVYFLYTDAHKQVWVGTSRGLACLVQNAAGEYQVNNIIPTGACTAIREDATSLYFGTRQGQLVIYDKKEKTYSHWNIANSRINALFRSRKQRVLYATTNTGKLITFNIDNKRISTAAYTTGESLHTLYEDKKGRLWIEPAKKGIIRFNPATAQFVLYSQHNNDPLNPIKNHIKVIEDNNGLIWAYMKGGGFGYYREAIDSFDNELSTPDAGSTKIPANVISIYYDKAGAIWLTNNERQLIKIILQSNVFEQQLLVNENPSRYDNEVRGIYYDNRNRLWLGTKSGHLYVYENGKKLSGLFVNEPPEGLGLIYSMLQDSKGNMWLGTKGNGLYRASPLNASCTQYRLTRYLPGKDLPGHDIYSMLEDRQGRMWIGSFDKGLFQVVGEGDAIQFVQSGPAFANYRKEVFQKIRHMALDASGNIWIGTTNGLLLMNANPPVYTFASYRKKPGDKNSLGNNDIQFIYRDAQQRMWLATSGGGFCSATGDRPFQQLHFRNYTTRDGMPNDYVLSCAEDNNGNLWLATENGLSMFNPASKTFRNYDSYDGLPPVAFSEAAVCPRLPGGQLVYGTNKGFISFDPCHINNHRIAANIAFTNLQINNEDAGAGDINYMHDLRLQYNENIISIDYAILDSRFGNRHGLMYRLLGFDSTWHSDRLQRRATYTNLPPGKYVFEVKSLSNDLYSNTPYKSVAITILPPPWKTWWAYTIYVLVLATILFFIRRTALAMIRLRNKIAVEQKLAALKLHFFTNVSHELRTPLTLIVNPLEQLARKEKLSAEGHGYVEVAQKNASRMVRFINQLLDLRKIESNKATLHLSRVNIVEFVQKISDHFAAELQSKNIRLEIMPDQPELVAAVDADKMDVVVYNLLANAVKFTPEGKTIRIIIRSGDPFHIEVRDQGPGVDADKLEEIFELFYEGHTTAARQKGSGIGLALSKEIVHLHGGRIEARNNKEGGLSVTVTLQRGEVPVPESLKAIAIPGSTNGLAGEDAPLVLLVEDNDELRSFLHQQLSERYRVQVAGNGLEGWQKALQLSPDLILSDVMMPIMDGIQMLGKIKNDVNSSHIPVILLSARGAVENQIEALQVGADYYITKPFNNEFLGASIDNLLRQRKKLFDKLVKKQAAVELGPGPVVVTSKDETFLKEVILVVEEKMTDAGFNIEAVAEHMHMSRTTFYKKFKSLTGLTPVEFVKDMRLQRARQYLDAGADNISEVAYSAGFSNPKYFSTCFREKYKVSPSDYMKAKGV